MQPAMLWEFSYNQHLGYLVDTPVFKSARPGSEQVLFDKRGDGRRLEMICP